MVEVKERAWPRRGMVKGRDWRGCGGIGAGVAVEGEAVGYVGVDVGDEEEEGDC